MNPPLIIIGAGGHAGVVADALLAAGQTVLGFVDRDQSRPEAGACGLPVLGDEGALDRHAPSAIALVNGIGGIGAAGDSLRRDVQQRLAARGWRFVGLRHPSAVASPFAEFGEAVQLHAGSVVRPGVRIGEGCIVNTVAVIEHDTALGAWCHVAPRAVVCGDVRLGVGCHIGAGAVIRQGVRLAAGTVVGAGAVVVADVERAGLLVGVPARLRGGGE